MSSDKKQQLVAAKRRELEEKQRRWMLEKQQEDLNPSFNNNVRGNSFNSSSSTRNSVDSSSSNAPMRTQSSSSTPRNSDSRTRGSLQQSDRTRTGSRTQDEVLHLTKSQLSDHIRDEIARELQSQRGISGRNPDQNGLGVSSRDHTGFNCNSSSDRPGSSSVPGYQYQPIMRQTAVVDESAQHRNLEQYVMQTEANSHTCKICFELMVSPQRTPMFLYPCGHTFCKDCMNRHTNQQHQHQHQQQHQHQHGGAAKPCCPFCRTVIQSMVANQAIKELIDSYVEQKAQLLPPINQRSEQEVSEQVYQQYNAVVSSCEIRRGVIKQELAERSGELDAQRKRKRKLDEADDHLKRERAKVTEKILELQEELSLLDDHQASQITKHAEVDSQIDQTSVAVTLLQGTLSDIEQQIEKAVLIRAHNE